jgi:hypothetical protein
VLWVDELYLEHGTRTQRGANDVRHSLGCLDVIDLRDFPSLTLSVGVCMHKNISKTVMSTVSNGAWLDIRRVAKMLNADRTYLKPSPALTCLMKVQLKMSYKLIKIRKQCAECADNDHAIRLIWCIATQNQKLVPLFSNDWTFLVSYSTNVRFVTQSSYLVL